MKTGLVILAIVLLVGMSWIAFNSEKVISQGRIHVHKPVVFPKNTPELQKHTLVFFGFVGCTSVCTPRMKEIADIYTGFTQKSDKKNLSVLFINLKSSISTKEADTYAKAFHPAFSGVTFEPKDLLTTLRMFQAYYAYSLIDSTQIEHTQFLYFVHKDTQNNFYLNNIYTHAPFNVELVINDLIKDFE